MSTGQFGKHAPCDSKELWVKKLRNVVIHNTIYCNWRKYSVVLQTGNQIFNCLAIYWLFGAFGRSFTCIYTVQYHSSILSQIFTSTVQRSKRNIWQLIMLLSSFRSRMKVRFCWTKSSTTWACRRDSSSVCRSEKPALPSPLSQPTHTLPWAHCSSTPQLGWDCNVLLSLMALTTGYTSVNLSSPC